MLELLNNSSYDDQRNLNSSREFFMKKILGFILLVCCAPFALADQLKIGVVNVTELYNKSAFIQNSSKTLQEDIKGMEEKLQAQKAKIQTLISSYEKTSDDKKKTVAQEITAEQTQLNKMSQAYQKKIQETQAAGLKKFTDLVKSTVDKIAKEKQLNAVLNSNSVVYSDSSWIDITSDVEAAMPKE